jgi:hypothetical protein
LNRASSAVLLLLLLLLLLLVVSTVGAEDGKSRWPPFLIDA